MELLIKIGLAHFFGDFVFQSSNWVADKETKGLGSRYFWLHIAIHFLLMIIFTAFDRGLIPYILGITLSHILIDVLKIKLKNHLSPILLFLGDQVLHLLIIALSVGFYLEVNWMQYIPNPSKIWILLMAFVSLSSVSGIVMKVFLSKWKISDLENDSLEKAGWYIGVLERFFIFGFIFLDYWAGIGFLIAAKSIFRFSDLSRAKDRKLTEYVLIGTLLSYGIAMIIALVSLYLWDKV